MAARANPKLTDAWREKIKTSMIINRLNDLIEGKAKMEPTQVSAALGLLRKALPDLQATDNTVSGNVTIEIVRFSDTSPK